MNNVIRSIRSQVRSPSVLSRTVSFRQTTDITPQPGSPNIKLEKSQNSSQTAGDMSNSFEEGYATKTDKAESGGGYATRSDEAGFGGTMDGSQSLNNIEADREINEHSNSDKNQGS